jgi:hypothetical protein
MARSRDDCFKVNAAMHFLRILSKYYRQQYENFACYVTLLLWRIYLGINVNSPPPQYFCPILTKFGFYRQIFFSMKLVI